MAARQSIMRWLEHITFTKLINLVGPMWIILIKYKISNSINILKTEFETI